MKFIKSKKLMLNLMATGGVVAGMAFTGGNVFAATETGPYGQAFIDEVSMVGTTETAHMGAITNNNYLWITGGTQTVYWGDGQSSSGGINELFQGMSWDNYASHTYSPGSPGRYFQVVLSGYLQIKNNYNNEYHTMPFAGLDYFTSPTI